MSKTYYKAVRLDGTDFYSGTVRWLPEDLTLPEGGWLVTHPRPHPRADSGYLSVSVSETECVGMSWPCLLLRVEPRGKVWTPKPLVLPLKRAGYAWKVVEVLNPLTALGPQGAEMVALIQAAGVLTSDQTEQLHAAWDASLEDVAWVAALQVALDAALDDDRQAARYSARQAIRDSTRYAPLHASLYDVPRYAAWRASRNVAQEALNALLVRDLISRRHYDTLTLPWRGVVGPIHPDDES